MILYPFLFGYGITFLFSERKGIKMAEITFTDEQIEQEMKRQRKEKNADYYRRNRDKILQRHEENRRKKAIEALRLRAETPQNSDTDGERA